MRNSCVVRRRSNHGAKDDVQKKSWANQLLREWVRRVEPSPKTSQAVQSVV
jgi:hypothetical protein